MDNPTYSRRALLRNVCLRASCGRISRDAGCSSPARNPPDLPAGVVAVAASDLDKPALDAARGWTCASCSAGRLRLAFSASGLVAGFDVAFARARSPPPLQPGFVAYATSCRQAQAQRILCRTSLLPGTLPAGLAEEGVSSFTVSIIPSPCRISWPWRKRLFMRMFERSRDDRLPVHHGNVGARDGRARPDRYLPARFAGSTSSWPCNCSAPAAQPSCFCWRRHATPSIVDVALMLALLAAFAAVAFVRSASWPARGER